MKKTASTRLTGLDQFGLSEGSFRRLSSRNVHAYIYLRTYDVTATVRKLEPSARYSYLSKRVNRWINNLQRLFPEITSRSKRTEAPVRKANPWASFPGTLTVSCSAKKLLQIAVMPGASSVHVSRIEGRRAKRATTKELTWYCVRALVVIRVEGARKGLQTIEDRFVLVRASSFDDAEKRLKSEWVRYAAPYLNSNREIVSWQFDHVVDVYDIGETAIDPAGSEIYSKLSGRRMTPQYIWRPAANGPLFKPRL